ncbi:putative integral membrane protein [Cryptosporidium felis]|nr:putative integral membrane protein [Cryptosporidium felis]
MIPNNELLGILGTKPLNEIIKERLHLEDSELNSSIGDYWKTFLWEFQLSRLYFKLERGDCRIIFSNSWLPYISHSKVLLFRLACLIFFCTVILYDIFTEIKIWKIENLARYYTTNWCSIATIGYFLVLSIVSIQAQNVVNSNIDDNVYGKNIHEIEDVIGKKGYLNWTCWYAWMIQSFLLPTGLIVNIGYWMVSHPNTRVTLLLAIAKHAIASILVFWDCYTTYQPFFLLHGLYLYAYILGILLAIGTIKIFPNSFLSLLPININGLYTFFNFNDENHIKIAPSLLIFIFTLFYPLLLMFLWFLFREKNLLVDPLPNYYTDGFESNGKVPRTDPDESLPLTKDSSSGGNDSSDHLSKV